MGCEARPSHARTRVCAASLSPDSLSGVGGEWLAATVGRSRPTVGRPRSSGSVTRWRGR